MAEYGPNRSAVAARLAVNHYICGPDVPFPAFADAVCRAGIPAVGLTRAAVAEMGVAALGRCLADNGLAASSLNSAGYFTDPDAAGTRRGNEEMVDHAAELGADVLCVIAGGLGVPALPTHDARRRVREGLEALHRRAADAGVTLGIEPIHPADIVTKGCINSIAAADELTRDLDGVKLIVDFYHSWWDPAFPRFVVEAPHRVALLQVCNVRLSAGAPVGRDGLVGGDIDIAPYIRAPAQSAYEGRIELELFERDLGGRDPLALIAGFPGEIAALTAR